MSLRLLRREGGRAGQRKPPRPGVTTLMHAVVAKTGALEPGVLNILLRLTYSPAFLPVMKG